MNWSLNSRRKETFSDFCFRGMYTTNAKLFICFLMLSCEWSWSCFICQQYNILFMILVTVASLCWSRSQAKQQDHHRHTSFMIYFCMYVYSNMRWNKKEKNKKKGRVWKRKPQNEDFLLTPFGFFVTLCVKTHVQYK